MSLLPSENKELRQLILNEVDKCCSSSDIAIGLSSGIDSHTILFALLELGHRPTVYTFTKDDRITKDFKVAKKTAEIFNLEHKIVFIPSKLDEERIRILICDYDLKKKTDIEVLYTMSFVFESMKERIAFFGYPDHHFGLSKKAMINYRQTLELNQKWRTMNASFNGMRQAYKWQEIGKEECGLEVKLPLGHKELVKFFHPFTWDELNTPKLKQPLMDAFPEYFAQIKVRAPQPLQTGDTGIREIFDQLLSSDLNSIKTKNLVSLYREIWKSNKPRNKLKGLIDA